VSDPVREIARAVLYEGYLLWPYRRSAVKNRQRFTFGGVHPRAFARRHGDAWEVRCECLVEGPGSAVVTVEARFLHLLERRPARRDGTRLAEVDELTVAGERQLAFEEAREREARAGPHRLDALTGGHVVPARIAGGEEREWLTDEDGARAGAIVRRWEPLDGVLEVASAPLGPRLHRLCVRFANRSTWDGEVREEALRRTFLSTHLVARCTGGAFVSAIDPPAELAPVAVRCTNKGLWPVLVGEQGARDTVLAAPVILSDYPQVAPESPGDLFDGCEIDALLVHSIRGLTDAERAEMAATDPRARELLERSLALTPEQMARLHGAVRELHPLEES
jgi:hypothetical protein